MYFIQVPFAMRTYWKGGLVLPCGVGESSIEEESCKPGAKNVNVSLIKGEGDWVS